MLLEEKVEEVSNRHHSIEEAIAEVKEDEEEVTEEDFLETEITDLPQQGIVNVSYSSQEEQQLAERLYGSNSNIDYGFTVDNPNSTPEGDYWTSTGAQETEAETLTTEEARESVARYQFAKVLGNFNDISYKERKKMAMWANLNPAELQLFHREHAMTNDVDYSQVF